MAEQWQRDTATGDYVVTDGSPVKTSENDLRTPAYLRLKIDALEWMYAPDNSYGNRLKDVQKNNSSTPTLVKTLAEQALQPMIDDKRAVSAEVTILARGRDSILYRADILDANGNTQTTETEA